MSVNKQKISILYVEDDPYLSLIIVDFLESKGFGVLHFTTAEAGLSGYKQNKVDICILDIGLPKKNGFWLAEEIKKIDENIPVIFLTAQKDKNSIVEGFELGADDYIRKPFLPDELFLRIKALLKRTRKSNITDNESFICKEFEFNYKKQVLKIIQREINLSYREAGLLKLFLENPNKILNREFLLKEVWGHDDLSLARSMDVYISKLRKHFKDLSNVKIVNVRNLGFKFILEE